MDIATYASQVKFLLTKKCSCLYMLRQGPYITVYIYTERFVIMRVLWGLTA